MSKNKKLRELAAKLPALPLKKMGPEGVPVIQTTIPVRVISGKQWLKENPEAKTKEGTVPELKSYYKFELEPQPILIDHFKELSATLKEAGVDGVNKYIKICFEFNMEKVPDGLIFTL